MNAKDEFCSALMRGTNDFIKFAKAEAETSQAIQKFQGVADPNGKFLHVSTGYAGSIHDARVLRMSSLLTAIEDGDILHFPLRRIGSM